jgi:diguanylate cyclase (GGDEF)-like protein
LLPQVGLPSALEIADRVRRSVSGDTVDSGDSLIQIPIRISMGVAALISGGDLDKLIRAADAALYRAKHGGGDRTAS